MPNSYFSFKQFTVYHDRCAMKVGTDGVMLGAWTDVSDTQYILDVGTGTGLIALMVAQRNNNSSITAIDIDVEAIEQAKENVMRSSFSSQVECLNISLQDFQQQATHKYDLIVSNPPFFVQSLKSPQEKRSLARHADTLPIEDLISSQLLTDKGRISLIYPYEYKSWLLQLAEDRGLYVSRITNVYPTPRSLPKRILMEFSMEVSSLKEGDLIVEDSRHVYSYDFTALLKDFYLKM